MLSDQGTDGISHMIHVANDDDGELSNFRKFENVVDVMNLPDGSLKFYYENGQKIIQSGRLVRSKVRGLDTAFRYRCSKCNDQDTDLISQTDRGSSVSIECHICKKNTDHEKREINDV